MNYVQLSYMFISGFSFLAGVLFLHVAVKTSAEDKTYLYFSLMSLCLAIIAGADVKGLFTPSVDEYLLFQRIAIASSCLYFIFLNFFIAHYANIKPKAYLLLITLCFLVILLGFIFFPYTMYFKSISAMTPIKLGWGEIIYAPDAEPSDWIPFIYIVVLSVLIYLIIATILQFKRRDTKDAAALALAVGIIVLAGLRDVWMETSGRQSFYLIEYSFFFLVLIMGIRMSTKVIESGQTKKELTKSEKRWRTLLERVQLAVVGLDNQGKVNYVNPYYLKLTGFKKENVIDRNWFNNFVPDTEGSEMEHVFKHIDSHRNYQNVILTHTGGQRIIAWSNVALQDSQERFIGTLSVGADITEKINSENELKSAYEKVQELKNRLQDENIYLKEELSLDHDFGEIIGQSAALKYVLKRVEQVADKDTNILLEGETGVGKELFARAIHYNSHRKERPLVKVNCAAIPANFIESELFGHTKGAFTGAHNQRKGRFEIADGGTLFLDEIGDLPPELQPKLLRVLQDGEFEPLGSSITIKTDVRVVAATNRVLKEEVDAGRFREDLYYRLSVYPISLPPLRRRHGDISLLVNHLVQYFAKKHGKTIKQIPQQAMSTFEKYRWPGNVRELQNVIERAVITTPGNVLQLQENLHQSKKGAESNNGENPADITDLKEIERLHILKVLKQCDWRIEGENGAAPLLGLKPSTLRSRMKNLGIKRPV